MSNEMPLIDPFLQKNEMPLVYFFFQINEMPRTLFSTHHPQAVLLTATSGDGDFWQWTLDTPPSTIENKHKDENDAQGGASRTFSLDLKATTYG